MKKTTQFDGKNGNGYQPLPVENSESARPPGSTQVASVKLETKVGECLDPEGGLDENR